MQLEDLKSIKKEIARFNTRLNAAIERVEDEPTAIYGCKETGAVRRAALDLKMELTKITK